MNSSDIFQFLRHIVPPRPHFTEKDYPDLTGKVYIVTGGCTGIGYWTTRNLLVQNAKVWIVARNQAKIDAAIQDFNETLPDCEIDYIVVDYTDLSNIKPAFQRFLDTESRLDGIVHNAGVMNPPAGSKTEQGYELQLGVNDIAPHLIQKLVDPLLLKTASAEDCPAGSCRIVWVSSSAQIIAPVHGGIFWQDINHERRQESGSNAKEDYGGWTLYGQSKAINIYQAYMWSEVHPESKVVSVSCHPGNVFSELQRHLSYLESLFYRCMTYPPQSGALTECYCLLSPELNDGESSNGAYIVPFGYKGFPRQDIATSLKGPTGPRIWRWLDQRVSEYT